MSRLREIRVLKRITQFELMLETGINTSRISVLENYPIEPRPDEKQRLAKALNVKAEEIWSDDGTRPTT